MLKQFDVHLLLTGPTGCLRGMVLVTEEDCRAGGVDPCPPTCSDLSMASNCSATCVIGKDYTHGMCIQCLKSLEDLQRLPCL